MPIENPLVVIARGELGVHETSTNRGPGIEKYWKATDYPEGYKEREPWCAAFVAWCVAQYLGMTAARPKSAAVSKWVPTALKLGWQVFGPRDGLYFPRAGDIAVFTFSHIGLVEDFTGHDVVTIEGNTDEDGGREGKEVARRKRMLKVCRSFIRVPAQ